MTSCADNLPTITSKAICDAIGGKRVYTDPQLKTLYPSQKKRDIVTNDFYNKHCGAGA